MRDPQPLPRLCFLVLAAGVLAPVAPAAGDWLVTRDGAAIETEGPWRLDGEEVVFTLRGGALAALPVAEVDLEASRQRAAAAETAPAAAPRASARWTITDADVARALDLEPGSGSPADRPPRQTSAVTGVSVASWEETQPPELGVALAGTLSNDGTDYAANLRVHVALHDEEGGLIERKTTVPVSTTLAPGESTEFTIEFSDVVAFSEARFAVEGRGFAGAPRPAGGEVLEPAVEEAESEPLSEEPPTEESLEAVPGEPFDETYGEGIEEEFPAVDEAGAPVAA